MNEQIIIFAQIVFIDLVLAGDNAIIIGMVASQFPPDQRKKIIFWGIGAAVILRIILTLLTATVTISAPDNLTAFAHSFIFLYLPVPTIKRDVNFFFAIVKLSAFIINLRL